MRTVRTVKRMRRVRRRTRASPVVTIRQSSKNSPSTQMLEYCSLTIQAAFGLPVKRYTDQCIDFYYTHGELGVPWVYEDRLQLHYYNVEIVKLNVELLERDGPYGPFPSDGRYFARVRINGPSSFAYGIRIYCDEVASAAPPDPGSGPGLDYLRR